MGDEPVEEGDELALDLRPLARRESLELGHRQLEAVGQLHVAAPELANQAHVVVAGDAEPGPRRHHGPDRQDGVDAARSPVDEVPDEDSLASLRVSERNERLAVQPPSSRRSLRRSVRSIVA